MTLIIGIAHRIQRKRKRHETKAVTLKEILVGGKKKTFSDYFMALPFSWRRKAKKYLMYGVEWSGIV